MHNVHIRNINTDLMYNLKQQATERSVSLNKWIITILQKASGVYASKTDIRHDFDQFSGKWTQQEADTFQKNTAAFSSIDEDLWK